LAPLQTVAADDERTLGKSKRGHARSWSKENWCEAEPHRVAGKANLSRSRQFQKRRRKHIWSFACESPVNRRPNPGNSAQQWAWHGSGAIKLSGMSPGSFSLRSTDGLPKGLTRAIWRRRRPPRRTCGL